MSDPLQHLIDESTFVKSGQTRTYIVLGFDFNRSSFPMGTPIDVLKRPENLKQIIVPGSMTLSVIDIKAGDNGFEDIDIRNLHPYTLDPVYSLKGQTLSPENFTVTDVNRAFQDNQSDISLVVGDAQITLQKLQRMFGDFSGVAVYAYETLKRDLANTELPDIVDIITPYAFSKAMGIKEMGSGRFIFSELIGLKTGPT